MSLPESSTIELDRVLLIADDEKVTIGTPTIEGAKVVATWQGEGNGKKVIVFKYKPKVRYRVKRGHRQFHTSLIIDKIIEPGSVLEKPRKRTRQSNKEVTANGS